MRSSAVVLAVLMLAAGIPAPNAALDELPEDYLPFAFTLADSGLVGSSEHLAGFTITMAIPRQRFPDGIELGVLLAAIRDQQITGTLTYPDGHATAIAYEMVHHRGPAEIYMKTTLGYFLWEHVAATARELHMAIYWWYSPPATPADLEVLHLATLLLANPDAWRREDDRNCTDDSTSGRWSLFCALKHASIATMSEYNHHNRAMQTVRFVIEELVPEHNFAHTLMDFNNATTTSHLDVLHVLDLARQRIEADLAPTTRTSGPD